ncbi:hypothetical protein GCM10010300_82820 [Streptomyces olivaceoviridis]|uniref:hypothetical protein n=1 Tax=Streptomyces olivaceoviridis TaxID=1921 RepID=UPI00167ADE6A|nr:hypothetical protein [Streptomyces olivaceoviridis]GGZ26916.1 hypothetical protein GCM10010300_82820 [Streptomyces olivaceoviridis]
MRKRRKKRMPAVHLELCDVCGATFPEDEAVRGYVPDSSSVSRRNDWFDGMRLITACSTEHFAVLRKTYQRRPFTQEELWAAKVNRVLTSGTPALTLGELACRTGLDETEIRRAVAWHNEHGGWGTVQ